MYCIHHIIVCGITYYIYVYVYTYTHTQKTREQITNKVIENC